MSWYKKANNDFESFFDSKKKLPTVLSKDPPVRTEVVLTLYRGLDLDLQKLKKQGEHYILSPEKSEQKAMWFTHNLIRGYNPIDYVSGRGNYLLTYPLKCWKHSQILHYDDNSTQQRIPDEIIDIQNPTENCKYYMGYELPDGWFFSYKTEKFIICTIPIFVSDSMLQKQT